MPLMSNNKRQSAIEILQTVYDRLLPNLVRCHTTTGIQAYQKLARIIELPDLRRRAIGPWYTWPAVNVLLAKAHPLPDNIGPAMALRPLDQYGWIGVIQYGNEETFSLMQSADAEGKPQFLERHNTLPMLPQELVDYDWSEIKS